MQCLYVCHITHLTSSHSHSRYSPVVWGQETGSNLGACLQVSEVTGGAEGCLPCTWGSGCMRKGRRRGSRRTCCPPCPYFHRVLQHHSLGSEVQNAAAWPASHHDACLKVEEGEHVMAEFGKSGWLVVGIFFVIYYSL